MRPPAPPVPHVRHVLRVPRPLVALVLAGLLAPLLVLVTTTGPVAASPAGTYARQVVRVTNTIRDNRDRHTLRAQACLKRKAVKQARRMAAQQEMFHQDLGPVLADCGLSMAGENVAFGFDTGKAVVKTGWMLSAGHRENILRRQYRLIGVGAAKDENGVWYAAQVFGRKA